MIKLLYITLFLSVYIFFVYGLDTPQSKCSSLTTCKECTSNSSWTGDCQWCEIPDLTGTYCHDRLSPLNPCNIFCPMINKNKPEECAKEPTESYDPIVASELLLLSSAAYSKAPESCLNTFFEESSHWELINYTAVICDWAGNECAGYIAYSKKSNAVVLAFRGSHTLTQLLLEGIETMVPNDPWKTGGTVVHYFSRTFHLLWPSLSAAMQNYIPTLSKPTVYVTGHSFGGALASLAATLLVESKLVENPIVYTFGQPRTGDYDYALGYDTRVKNTWRIVHYIDPVPHIPLCGTIEIKGIPLPICSACQKDKAYHHGREVYYDYTHFPMPQEGNWTECINNYPRNEAFTCSDGVSSYGIDCIAHGLKCLDYHYFYFGNIQVGMCGSSNCKDPIYCHHQWNITTVL